MPFLALGSGYVVMHSLAVTQLVKSVTFRKCEKCKRVLYKVKYKMVMCVFVVENLLGTDLPVSLDLSELVGKVWPSVRNGCFKISLKISVMMCSGQITGSLLKMEVIYSEMYTDSNQQKNNYFYK